MRHLAVTLAVLGCVATTGCLFDSTVPADARVRCSDSRECAGGQECRAGGLCAAFDAERDAPGIVSAALVPARGRAGTRFTLTLEVDEQLVSDPVVGPLPFFVEQRDDERYTLTFVAGDDAVLHGLHPLTATFGDLRGNVRENVHVADLTIDNVAPSVVAATLFVRYAPPAGADVDASAVGVGGSAIVSFSVDDVDVTEAPRVTVGSAAGAALSLTAASPPSFMYQLTDTSGLATGPLDLVVALADSVGNEHEQTLPGALMADAAPPAAPDGSLLTLARVPWGDATGGPRCSLSGSGFEPGARVMFFDAPSLDAALLASTVADGSGAIAAIQGSVVDVATAYAVQFDAAAQVSPFALVSNVSWRGTLRGKVAGSTFENPHRLVSAGGARAGAGLELGIAFGASEQGDQDDADGVVARARWTSRLLSRAGGGTGAIGFDAARGGLVQGGASSMSLWADDGFVRLPVRDPEGDGEPLGQQTALVIDDRRDRMIACVEGPGPRLWSWDGRSFRALDGDEAALTEFPATTFPSLMACAFDSVRGVLVAYGGVGWPDDGVVVELDVTTDTLSRIAPAGGGPSSRYAAHLAFDPASGTVLLLDGQRADGGGPDAWSWDGSVWTALPRDPALAPAALFELEAHAALVDQGGALWRADGAGGWAPLAGVDVLPSPPGRYALAASDLTLDAIFVQSQGSCYVWGGASWTAQACGGVSAVGFPPNPIVHLVPGPDNDGDGTPDVLHAIGEGRIVSFDDATSSWRQFGVAGPPEPDPTCASFDGALLLLFFDDPAGPRVQSWDGSARSDIVAPGAPIGARLAGCAFSPALDATVVVLADGQSAAFVRSSGWSPLPAAPSFFFGTVKVAMGPGQLVTVFASQPVFPFPPTDVVAFDGARWDVVGTTSSFALTLVASDPGHQRLLLSGNDGIVTWDGRTFDELEPPVDVDDDGEPLALRAVAAVGNRLIAVDDATISTETWELGIAPRPAIAAQFDLRPARIPADARVDRIAASARIGGDGGATLEMFVRTRWQQLAATAAPVGAPLVVTGELTASAHAAVYRDGITLRALPSAATVGETPAEVEAGGFQIDVTYALAPE